MALSWVRRFLRSSGTQRASRPCHTLKVGFVDSPRSTWARHWTSLAEDSFGARERYKTIFETIFGLSNYAVFGCVSIAAPPTHTQAARLNPCVWHAGLAVVQAVVHPAVGAIAHHARGALSQVNSMPKGHVQPVDVKHAHPRSTTEHRLVNLTIAGHQLPGTPQGILGERHVFEHVGIAPPVGRDGRAPEEASTRLLEQQRLHVALQLLQVLVVLLIRNIAAIPKPPICDDDIRIAQHLARCLAVVRIPA
eukprot:scaffold15653_cov78-Phaeocystis_antarctica.AAC.3